MNNTYRTNFEKLRISQLESIYNGVKSLRYIEKILLNWKDKGYKSKSDVINGLKEEADDNILSDLYDYNCFDNE